MTPKQQPQKFRTDDVHYPDLFSAPVKQIYDQYNQSEALPSCG